MGLRTTERRQGSGIWSRLLVLQIGKPRHRMDSVAHVCRHLGLVHLLRPCFPSKAGWSASGQSLWCVSSTTLPPAVSVCSCHWPDACQVRVCGEGAVGYMGRSSGFGKPPCGPLLEVFSSSGECGELPGVRTVPARLTVLLGWDTSLGAELCWTGLGRLRWGAPPPPPDYLGW